MSACDICCMASSMALYPGQTQDICWPCRYRKIREAAGRRQDYATGSRHRAPVLDQCLISACSGSRSHASAGPARVAAGASMPQSAVRKNGVPKMIDLYYWPTPNGHKITLFLEEAGIPYTIKPVNISKGEQFQPDFLKFSPNNTMPAIIHSAPSDAGEAISALER